MYLTHLYPQPNSLRENNAVHYAFGAKETLHVNHALTPAVAERMIYLWRRFCCSAGKLTIEVHEDASTAYTAWLGVRQDVACEHYAIRSDGSGVTLSATDEKALMEGFSSLVQLICPVELDVGAEQFYIAQTEIEDKPSIGLRSIHLCIFPNSDISTIEKAVHLAGFLKFSHVVLEFWGVLEFDVCRELAWEGYSWPKEKAKRLIGLVRSYGMEVIPMFNHVGHASGSRSCYGRHVVLNRNPRMAKLFEPGGWTWCSTNPKTAQLLREVRAELMELCGPGAYFHIGADESYSFATCDKCREHAHHELFAEWINALTADLAAHGRRPIMWHDQLINREKFPCKDHVVATGQDNNTAAAIELLDRRVILADWQYSYISGENPTTPYFMEKGFDTVLCPWDDIRNIRSLCTNARTLGAYGVMLTTWDHLPKYIGGFLSAANAMWTECISGDKQVLWTENASILRNLYDTAGDFALSGWHKNEVDE